MKSMNSATPASRAPGPSSLGMIISESRTTTGYSSARKNCGVYVTLLICCTPFAAACTGSQANAHLLNPANPAATEAVAKILNSSRRSIPCPAITHPPFAAINPSPRSCAGAAPLRPMSALFLELIVLSRPENGERSQSQPATKKRTPRSPQILHTLLNQLLRRPIRIPAPAIFNRAVPPIPACLQNPKRLRQIDRIVLPVLLEIPILHMTNSIRMLKHRRNRAVRKIRIPAHHRIRKIRQRMQIRIVHAFDDLHDKKRILADKIVVLHVYDNISRLPVRRDFLHALHRVREIRLHVFCLRDVRANAGRADRHSNVDPFLGVGDRSLSRRAVRVVKAILLIHRDVDRVSFRAAKQLLEFL